MCRRWHRLAASPALLQHVCVRLGSAAAPAPAGPGWGRAAGVTQAQRDALRFLPRLEAFVAWLERQAAPHLRRLELELAVPPTADGRAVRRALADLKSALAQRCPRLADLRIRLGACDVKAGSWVAQLRGLRRLDICSAQGLRFGADLAAHCALRELRLHAGGGLRVAGAAALPPCLTALALEGARDEALPVQVGKVTCCGALGVLRCRRCARHC